MSKNSRGFTLIEVMVAMVILLIVGLGLLRSTVMVMENNFKNILRDEAVRVAEQEMSRLRNLKFSALPAGPAVGWGVLKTGWDNDCITIPRAFRGIQNFPFTMCERIIDLSADAKEIKVAVGWDYKGTGNIAPTVKKYQHSLSTIVGKGL